MPQMNLVFAWDYHFTIAIPKSTFVDIKVSGR